MNILSPNRKIILKASLEGKSLTFDAELAVPRVRIDIDLAVGRRLGGVSLESIPSTTLGYIYAIQTLDQVVKSLPEDFPEIRTFEEIDDQNFVIELFNDYDKQDRAFQAELKKITTLTALEDPETILDLFLLKEFGIIPEGMNKGNLFFSQKKFLLEATAKVDFQRYKRKINLILTKKQIQAMQASEFLSDISPSMAHILEEHGGYSEEMLQKEGELKRKEILRKIQDELREYE